MKPRIPSVFPDDKRSLSEEIDFSSHAPLSLPAAEPAEYLKDQMVKILQPLDMRARRRTLELVEKSFTQQKVLTQKIETLKVEKKEVNRKIEIIDKYIA
jgi:hypothetical protein